MAEPTRPLAAPAPSASPPAGEETGFEILVETRQPRVRCGASSPPSATCSACSPAASSPRSASGPRSGGTGILYWLSRLVAAFARVFLDRKLAARPFPVQLRRRLEMLGPTYIKLGQMLSLREDLLPPAITGELTNLLDRLPVVPFPRFMEIVAADLDRPVEEIFEWIDPHPLGSASIAQTHRGTLKSGESVILKAVKPGIRDTLRQDASLLWLLGRLLQLLFPRVRPKRLIDEFVHYTLREVDLRLEADNAETFEANFKDEPDVVFPRIYRAGERQGPADHGVPGGVQARLARGPSPLRRRPRPAGRPRRGGDHQHDLPRRVLPRRPPPRQSADPRRPQGGLHRPRHGGAVLRRAEADAALLLLLPGHRRRRQRRPLPGDGGRGGAGGRPQRLSPRGGRDLPPLAAGGELPRASRSAS